MIGGGEYLNFLENSSNLDEELFVRYAQCATLMPMMQFSANLGEYYLKKILKFVKSDLGAC